MSLAPRRRRGRKGRLLERQGKVLRWSGVTRRLLGGVRAGKGEVRCLVANGIRELRQGRPVREDPDDRRVVGRVRALEAVAQPVGRRRHDGVDEDDRRLRDAELTTGLVERGQGRFDVHRVGMGRPDPIRLDVDAAAREVRELRERIPADREGPVW